MGTGCDTPTIERNPNVRRLFIVIVIIIDMVGTKKICSQEFNVENEDFLPGTTFRWLESSGLLVDDDSHTLDVPTQLSVVDLCP